MTSSELMRLAQLAGVEVQWEDASGSAQTVEPGVVCNVLRALGLPADTPTQATQSLARLKHEQHICPPLLTATVHQGYEVPGNYRAPTPYQLSFENGEQLTGSAQPGAQGSLQMPPIAQPGYHRLVVGETEVTIAVAPERCVLPDDLTGQPGSRLWGIAAQLYSLRRSPAALSGSVGGIGDFSALASLAREAARQGADALAISPVHAMFSADTTRYSPYSPSSRLFLNALYADPLNVFTPEAVAQTLRRLRMGPRMLELEALDLIDWPETGRLRLTLLRELFLGFPANSSADLQKAFRAFREQGGEALEHHARFEALHAHHLANGAAGWQQWPAEFRSPDSPAVNAFAASHAQDVRFHAFLQWLADRGLAGAHQSALDAGMRIGLIGDLAVGTDPGGSHAWSRQEEIITGLSPGAPPDLYNPNGQSWGLTAFAPRALRQHGFHAFIEMLRSALSHAGGVRIDHALGLARMWLVPEGADPKDGAYVSYPFDDMVRLICLESWRHRAIITAENLGTVPAGFNERIQAAGMLGMSVLWFERTDDEPPGFVAPDNWHQNNMATTSTHDLPTAAGWWQQRDLDWRAQLNLLGPVPEADQREERTRDRNALWQALRTGNDLPSPPDEAPINHIMRYVGETTAPLTIVPLEDVLGHVEQPNLPGTIDSHPNWRRRIDVPVEDIFHDALAVERLRILKQARNQS